MRKWIMVVIVLMASLTCTRAASSVILGWNNLGMHCMDSSYSEFSILPPYNTIEAQLIVGGHLVTNGSGYTLTYEAVADPYGSINMTSIGKGNWSTYAAIVYGIPSYFTADMGLAGWNMPGPLNIPQAMRFERQNAPAPGVSTPVNWFRAEGIPITPYDDAGNKNPYPLMRLVARDAAGSVIARSDVVLPVSDEMDCRVCHGANTHPDAMPRAGWITDPEPIREYRLNILDLHDDKEFSQHPELYADALAANGFASDGLLATALSGRPMLCAACHASEALGTPSFTSSHGRVPPLTASVHSRHATVTDPASGIALDNSENRDACYRCHPGSSTRCLRGAMGSAVAADGAMAMQCQSCHGGMSHVGSSTRVGWFMEPNCQSCHSGTAVSNNGAIRYSTVFDATGKERIPSNTTFATTPNTPAPGLSLYRFSVGHGGLQCSACHGSTHAEFPSSHDNDNLRNLQLQGHAGVISECATCHPSAPATVSGGPHGLHPLDQRWVESHHDAVSQVGLAACQTCHGRDLRGTVLSRAQGDRVFSVGDAGSVRFYRGATIGCYTCHQGPSKSDMNNAAPPAIANVTAQTMTGLPVDLVLPGQGTALDLRIVSQARNGSVGLSNGIATYFPFDGFVGTDAFTFAAYDGAKNSVLATGTVMVATRNPSREPPAITLAPVSQTATQGSTVVLTVTATGSLPLSYQWYRNGWPISGSGGASLTISPVTGADSGQYVVRVANDVGAKASRAVQLTVVVPPVILTQPVSQTVTQGSAVSFSVTASGAVPLRYQWSRNSTPLADATGSVLRLYGVSMASAGSYQVRVSNAGGFVDSSPATLTVLAPPAIGSFSPSSGGVGTAVTLTGANLTGATAVKINGATAPFTVLSATTIVCGVPAGASSGKISVTTPFGTATSASTFSVASKAVAPKISGFTPASGPAGTLVTVNGTNLGGAVAVSLGTKSVSSFTVLSAGSLRFAVPAGATSGRIKVTTAGGTGASSASFSVTP